MLNQKYPDQETNTEESIRLADQAARLAERGQTRDLENPLNSPTPTPPGSTPSTLPGSVPPLPGSKPSPLPLGPSGPTLPPQTHPAVNPLVPVVDEATRLRERDDRIIAAQMMSDGMPPNPLAPPEKPARVYMLGHNPTCVYRHEPACSCSNKEPLP